MDKAEPQLAVDDARPDGPPVGPSQAPSPVAEEGDARPSAAPAPLSHTDMTQLLDGVVERITTALQTRGRSETFQQELITRLHNDLQEQVNRSAVLPVVTGMLRLQEEMQKVAERLRASPGAQTPERMLQQFTEFAEDIGTLLEQAGVVRFVDEAMADQFNGSRQSMLGRDPTVDPALNLRISARVRPGADFGKTLLRREAVRVYAFEPAVPAAPPPSDPSSTTQETGR